MSVGALADRLAAVRETIALAAQRVGRDPSAVRIVAVTKTFPPAVVAAALAAGLEDVGENYVQEARAKRRAVGPGGTWHLIGGLQRNKVRAAVATFERVHTLDSPALAAALAAEAGRAGRRMPVLLQVNVTGEPSRRGVRPEEVAGLAEAVLALPALALDGLMAIPPPVAEVAHRRSHFRRLRELRDRARDRLGVELPHLSMGMSDDFVIAIEEGATMLRLGRALFGPRGPGAWREGS
ncbi:MAG TPA: YggS family pyridoxal phosphate-dependent enzyme [Candidatus Binatia bacterium]|nr:YggS family pyridoxal phosphate-dependent enzyme [Candidatus Binatia bacterium]